MHNIGCRASDTNCHKTRGRKTIIGKSFRISMLRVTLIGFRLTFYGRCQSLDIADCHNIATLLSHICHILRVASLLHTVPLSVHKQQSCQYNYYMITVGMNYVYVKLTRILLAWFMPSEYVCIHHAIPLCIRSIHWHGNCGIAIIYLM